MSDTKKLKTLGSGKTKYPTKPSINILETFNNQHKDMPYLVPFMCNEFTSLCPKTGQPDFAKFEIVYVPRVKMVESKSLKLYLFSFRNTGEFHEDVTVRIFNDLWEILNPLALRVTGDFAVRGGISIKPMKMAVAMDIKKNTSPSQDGLWKLFEVFDRNKSNYQD